MGERAGAAKRASARFQTASEVMLSRREAVFGSVASGLPLPAPLPARATRRASFLWGVATAAHRIEGGNTNSDYWVLETIPSSGFVERSGDACDSWQRWREDVALAGAIGLNCYRFSVEWARIEPEPGMFSLAALDNYRSIAIACREAGLSPVVTFHHFTSPRWIAAQGGWEKGYAPTPAGVERNRVSVDVSPDVIGAVAREVHAHCRAPILITEHGIDTLDDEQRARHLTASISHLRAAMVDGIPVLGYIHWSLLDNFEWSSGYAPRFALVAVDRTTFRRTPKPSAVHYRRLVKQWSG